jgi:hypothetical protein
MNEIKKETALAKSEKMVALTADFGKIYFKVQDGQIMAPVRADMTLYEKHGQIYSLKGKWSITASGYWHLNKVASISILKPQSVIVDGKPVPNPHIERNRRTKAIESVNIRAMGIGYSPAGNIVVIDKTLFYNAYTYFIQSIQAKMKRVVWKKDAEGNRVPTDEKECPNCALYGIAEEKPTSDGLWAFFPTEKPLGIWINYQDQAIVDCLEEHTQRQRFGDRMATTIVERNVLKDHPAIAAAQVVMKTGPGGNYANVVVHGWRNDNTPRDLADLMKQAEDGGESKDFEVRKETIVDVEAEEEKEVLEEVAADDSKPEKIGNPAKDHEPPEEFWEKKRADAAKGGKA